MLKTILWIAGACVAVLVALAVSRSLNLGGAPKPPEAPAAVEAAAPATAVVAPTPEVVVPPPPPPPTAEEQQIQDDAAATGMTTVEPDEAPKDPPTN